MVKKNEDIVEAVYCNSYINKYVVRKVMEAIFAEITASMAEGNSVQIHGFGTFEPREMKAKIGQDINHGNSVVIPARVYPKFRPGATLKKAVIKEKM